jgi:MHS family proline/betaine transporter-like MFS transporter
LVVAALMMLITVYPLLVWLAASHTTMTLIVVQTAFCVLVAAFVGIAPAALAEIFPTRVRSTGLSLSYNAAVTVFGGFAPAILTWFTQKTGNSFAPGWYVMAGSTVTLLSIAFMPRAVAEKVTSAQG